MDRDLLKKNFIYNALDDGWIIKKHNNKYYFFKKHKNKKEFFHESFLNEFVMKYIDSDIIDSNI